MTEESGAVATIEIHAVHDSVFRPVVGEAGTAFLAHLEREGIISSAAAATVRAESLSILSGCAPPRGHSVRRTGLVCGYVQSGKTVSMQTVSALGKDNGYRIVILIAGVTTNLVGQSRDRVEDQLRAGAGGYEWVMLTNPRDSDLPTIENLVQGWRNRPSGSPGARTLFVTVMKNKHHLARLTGLLGRVNLSGMPALIFDDEADQASLNTRPLDPAPSPIYQCIEDLRQALPHHTLLQYTATPQAPLLISRIDSLSADFAELVSPGEGYTGGQTFFRDRRDDLVRAIPVNEIFDHRNLPAEPPESLQEALQVYFIGVAASYAQGRHRTGHRSMLVHPHSRTPVHEAYMNWVRNYQRDWFMTLSSASDPDRHELLAEFERAYQEVAGTSGGLPAFGEVQQYLSDAIGHAIPTLVNSTNGSEIQWSNGYAHILVGGEKLGRGYTVKGLTVTYMPRGTGGWTADTIQQRARFFGYHAKPENPYLDYCRVYLHPDVLTAYSAYVAHEEDIRNQIALHREHPLQDLKRAFVLNRRLRPTRHNVMARLYRRPRLMANWFEQRVPHAAPDRGAGNLALVRTLIARLPPQPLGGFEDRHCFVDVALRELLEEFLIPFAAPDDRDALNLWSVLAAIANECDAQPNLVGRMIFMDHNRRARERRLQDGEIDLMQGPSSANEPGRYPGDRAISVPDRVTIQVHRVQVVVKEVGPDGRERVVEVVAAEAPALSIRLPDRVAEQLRDTIVQPEH